MAETPDGELTGHQRHGLLQQLYDALLRCLLAALTSDTPPKASLLEVARHFLVSEGITAKSRPDMRRGLEDLTALRRLPFDAKGRPQ
jgi:hypothetical protein